MPTPQMKIFIPITKVDAVHRLVYGVLAREEADKAGEIFDYASSKPYFERWSDGFQQATNGRSKGNVRAMHGKVAAGKFTEMVFNDQEKQIEVCAKVVDDAEWAKCEEGVYTGFSIGGNYVNQWPDTASIGKKRYTADPIEGSLVDLPCMPGALFTTVKADGSLEFRKFTSVLQEGELPTETTETETETEVEKSYDADAAVAKDDVEASAEDGGVEKAKSTEDDRAEGEGDGDTEAKDDSEDAAKKSAEPTLAQVLAAIGQIASDVNVLKAQSAAAGVVVASTVPVVVPEAEVAKSTVIDTGDIQGASIFDHPQADLGEPDDFGPDGPSADDIAALAAIPFAVVAAEKAATASDPLNLPTTAPDVMGVVTKALNEMRAENTAALGTLRKQLEESDGNLGKAVGEITLLKAQIITLEKQMDEPAPGGPFLNSAALERSLGKTTTVEKSIGSDASGTQAPSAAQAELSEINALIKMQSEERDPLFKQNIGNRIAEKQLALSYRLGNGSIS